MTLVAPRPMRAKSPASLHERIGAMIRQQILSGAWPPGFRIPVEHALMTQFGCSRMTVSKALSELALAGLIERRRRAGSFVSRPQVLSAVLEIRDIRAEILGLGRRYDYTLLSKRWRAASKADRAQLDLADSADVLALDCRHRADGRPFAVEQRLINLAAVPDAAHADFANTAPGTWLLAHVPWTEAEHRIASVPAAPRIAALLDIEPGAACLVIRRRTWRGPQTLTAVTLTYPGPLYEMVARFGHR